jgi:hypothetical protein
MKDTRSPKEVPEYKEEEEILSDQENDGHSEAGTGH